MSDFDLSEIFKKDEITHFTTTDEINSIKYITNLCFSGTINPKTNSKFPGTLVVSVSKRDLSKFEGLRMIHKPYKETELLPWLQGCKHITPQLHFSSDQKPQTFDNVKKWKTDVNINPELLDFGPHTDPSFMFFYKDVIIPLQLDFQFE